LNKLYVSFNHSTLCHDTVTPSSSNSCPNPCSNPNPSFKNYLQDCCVQEYNSCAQIAELQAGDWIQFPVNQKRMQLRLLYYYYTSVA